MTQAPVDSGPATPSRLLALPPLEDPRERVMVPAKRRLKLRHILLATPVIRVLALRDFRAKYKQSALGPLWAFFQPFALLVAFLVAFKGLGNVQTYGVPYAVFALVGLSVWSFFQVAATTSTSSLLANTSFIRYTPCPRPAFPIASILASFPTLIITVSAAILSAAATGHLSVRVLLLPFGIVWLLTLLIGTVALTSSLTVRFRDIISALPYLLQVGVFITPVGWSLAGLSPTLRAIVELNPLTGLIEAWRWMMLSGYSAALGPVLLSLGVSIVVCVAGWLVFSRVETVMADVI